MSVQAVGWALKLDIPAATKFVLVALCNYADDKGRCWPSQESLARDTSMSDRTVRRHVKQLEEAGLITRKGRWKDGGSRTSDMFWIHIEPNRNESPVSQTIPDNHDTHTGQMTQSIPDTESGEPSLEPSDIPNPNGLGAPDDARPLKDIVFSNGLKTLTAKGVADRHARSVLGKWRRDYGDAAVLEVLGRCEAEGIVDPVPWCEAALRAGGGARAGPGPPVDVMEIVRRMDAEAAE